MLRLNHLSVDSSDGDGSKIVIYNFLFARLLLLVELLDQLSDVVFDLEGLGSLQVLRLIRSEQHRILLLRAEI